MGHQSRAQHQPQKAGGHTVKTLAPIPTQEPANTPAPKGRGRTHLLQADGVDGDEAGRLGRVKRRQRVHGRVLLRVQLLLRGAAQAVGVALVQAEADLAVNLRKSCQMM